MRCAGGAVEQAGDRGIIGIAGGAKKLSMKAGVGVDRLRLPTLDHAAGTDQESAFGLA